MKNNITNNYDTAESDGSGPDTEDHIYLKSCYEMMSGIFTGNDESAENGYAARICAPSDFALSNEAYMYNDSSYTIPYRSQGPCSYWLRSAGTDKYSACFVSGSGRVYFNNSVNAASSGVRPALRLNIAA